MAAALPAIAVALAAAGTGVGTYAAFAQGAAAKDAAKSQEAAAKNEADVANQAAAMEARQIRRQNLLRLGTSRAAAAKSGVLIDDSAADVMYDTAIQGELEALSTIYSGRVGATAAQNQGRMAMAAGRAASRASHLQGAATLIGGLADMTTAGGKYFDARAKAKANNAPKMKS